MSEEEAKKFIADEVNKVLWLRLSAIAAALGVVTIGAGVALWLNILAQAQNIALAEVTKQTQVYTSQALASLTEIQHSLQQKYIDLLLQSGAATEDLKFFEKTKSDLVSSISNLSKEITELQKNFDSLNTSSNAEITEKLGTLRNLPTGDTQALIKKIDDYQAEIGDLRVQIGDKLSSKKIYRIKSETGAWYMGVYSGIGRLAEPITLGAESNNTPGMYWTFVQQ
jgi:alanyl-tRNA synthetase